MKAPAVPAHRPIRNFVRRCFEIPLGILMLVVLYPIYGARELWRDFVKFIDSWISLRARIEARSLQAPPATQTPATPRPSPGVPIPQETPAQRAAYEAEYGKLDCALGGGFPVGRISPTRKKINEASAKLPPHIQGPWNDLTGRLLGNQVANMNQAMTKQMNKLGQQFDGIFGQGMQGMADWFTFNPGVCERVDCLEPGSPMAAGLCNKHWLAHPEPEKKAATGGPENMRVVSIPTEGSVQDSTICDLPGCTETCYAHMDGLPYRRCPKHYDPEKDTAAGAARTAPRLNVVHDRGAIVGMPGAQELF